MSEQLFRLLLVSESKVYLMPLSGVARAGFYAESCHPRSAEYRLRSGRFDAAVLLATEPGAPAREFVAAWRELAPNTEVVVIYACRVEERRKTALLQAGVFDVREAAGNGFGEVLSASETAHLLRALRDKLERQIPPAPARDWLPTPAPALAPLPPATEHSLDQRG